MGLPYGAIAELANPVNAQASRLDADQAQQPHEVVWADTDSRP
jgi:hypothetical protein